MCQATRACESAHKKACALDAAAEDLRSCSLLPWVPQPENSGKSGPSAARLGEGAVGRYRERIRVYRLRASPRTAWGVVISHESQAHPTLLRTHAGRDLYWANRAGIDQRSVGESNGRCDRVLRAKGRSAGRKLLLSTWRILGEEPSECTLCIRPRPPEPFATVKLPSAQSKTRAHRDRKASRVVAVPAEVAVWHEPWATSARVKKDQPFCPPH